MLSENRVSLSRVINVICFIAVGMYSVFGNMTASIYQLVLPHNIEIYFAIVFGIVAVFRLFVSKLYKEYRFWMAVFFSACCMTVFFVTGYTFLPVLAFLALAVVKMPAQTVYRVVFWTQLLSLLVMVIGVQTNVIEDLIYITDTDGLRHSFGINYPTDFAAHIVFVVFLAYVVFSGISNLWFVGIVLFAFWISYYYCSAKCSTILLLLFLVLLLLEMLYAKLQKYRPVKWMDCVVAYGKCIAMPALCILSITIAWIYNGQEYLNRLNSFLTSRIVVGHSALMDLGMTSFGQTFDMLGNGGSLGYKWGYYFIDNSYILIAVRYGVVLLFLINIFYVLTMLRSKKHSLRCLMNVLFLIAIQAVIEHHMIEVWLNIFLVSFLLEDIDIKMPVKQNSRIKSEKSNASANSMRYLGVGMGAVLLAGLLVWSVELLFTIMRSFVKMTGLDGAGNHNVFVLCCMLGITVFAILIRALYKLLCSAWWGEKPRKIYGFIVLASVLSFAFLMAGMYGRVLKSTPQYDAAMVEEREVLQSLIQQEEFQGKIYVSDVPMIYRHFFGKIQKTLFTPELLDYQEDVVFIIPNDMENRVLLYDGYEYVQISSLHGIYTNSDTAKAVLAKLGYETTDYFNYRRHYTTEEMVRYNPDMIVDEDGKVLVRPWLPLAYGPHDRVYQGFLNLNVDLSLYDWIDDGRVLAEIRVCSAFNQEWFRVDITSADLDENGRYFFNADINIWENIDDLQITIYPKDKTQVKINDLSYQKVKY